MTRKKVGLVLGGGAARGIAHIGVLEVLEKENIPIDMIAGTSIGAVIGALYAQGKDAGSIKKLVLDLKWQQLALLVDLALPKSGFIRGKRIKDLLKAALGDDIEFGDLRIPLACVATDIVTGEEVVINDGSVLEGVRASISIPVIFAVSKWRDRYLVDGDLVNPVPVNVVRNMGADFIIAVNVIPAMRNRVGREGEKRAEGFKEPNIFHVVMQSIYISSYSLVKSRLAEADIVIEPRMLHLGYGDFHRASEYILQGEVAAQNSILEIKKQLEA